MTSVFQPVILSSLLFLCCPATSYQQSQNRIDSFRIHGDIKITIDKPVDFSKSKKSIVTFFALPNGNSTEQTMGKKMMGGDDWHFDIQHIRAQTNFIRQQIKGKNFVVIYLENNYKSWPSWKQKHPDFKMLIPHLVDSLSGLISKRQSEIYLNGHSGGGSFIFGYLAGVERIPKKVKRISFLDSDYGYDSSYYPKFKNWLKLVKGSALNVFAYNDSIALYNGKPFVSATGGTWYRSHTARSAWERTKLTLRNNQLQKDLDNQNLKQEIYTAYTNAVAALQKHAASRKAVQTAQRSYDLSKKRYDVNLLTSFELLTNQNNLFRAQIDLLLARYDYIFKMKLLEFYKGQGMTLE